MEKSTMSRILVIEDDFMLSKMIQQMLEHEGYDVLVASDGKDAEKFYQEGNLDLVITDVLMPEKDGLEVIVEIRSKMPQVKIIAISGGGRISHTDYLVTAKRLGAHRTLSKPFVRQDLINALKELLEP
jgi:DNA-binding response OmpR family regulator